MTVEELKSILTTHPDDQFIHMRIWPDDKSLVQATVSKVQQGVSGAVLLTGSVNIKN